MAPSLQKKYMMNGYKHLGQGDKTFPTEQTGGVNHRTATEETWRYVTISKLVVLIVVLASIITYMLQLPFYGYPIVFLVVVLPVSCTYIGFYNIVYSFGECWNQASKIDEYIEFIDDNVKRNYSGKFMPVRELYEYYANGKLDFKGDVLECLEHRNDYASYKLQWWHLKFFLLKLIPEMFHSKQQDQDQVCDHYDRGNDFYESFLGPLMVYTSGIRHAETDTLEDMQMNKVKDVCRKILLKQGDRHLDIGCGWGELVNFGAEHYRSTSTGVTIAQNQVDWANEKAKQRGIQSDAKFLCMDYRDIPKSKYDKITCLEMSEHVGIRLFPDFLDQVYNLLQDDGIFFLQIAGLRRAWQWEDMLWGFFMDTYIFPGADASLPLIFPVGKLEVAGFEIQSVETIGIHYSETIKRWYQNWSKPEIKEKMVNKYGVRLYRIWKMFLGWSTIIARQGNSTCYQIVAHKNLNHYPRKQFIQSKAEQINNCTTHGVQ